MGNRRGVRGQSVVEYTLLIVTVILAALYGITQVMSPKLKTQMDNNGTMMDGASTELLTLTGP